MLGVIKALPIDIGRGRLQKDNHGVTNAANQSGYYGIDICMCADLRCDANEAVRKEDSNELRLGELANAG